MQRKRYWRSKSKIKGTLRPSSIKKPGDCVSIDHLISAQPGLIPRICGKHTMDRICEAVVFKDHKSDLGYTHLMTSCNLEETIAAKQAFEKIAATYNVKIKHYHADNGHFDCQDSAMKWLVVDKLFLFVELVLTIKMGLLKSIFVF